MDLPWWVIGLLFVLLIGLVGVFFWQRKKARDDD
jgi:LPXTG-motif cell wall-anchored protein